MFIEFEKSLLNVSSVGTIKVTDTMDKYGSDVFSIVVVSINGNPIETFNYKTIDERDSKYNELKDILFGRNPVFDNIYNAWRCPNCKQTIWSTSKYCDECGQKIKKKV